MPIMPKSEFPLQRLDDIRKRPQDFRLLERIPLTVKGALNNLPLKLQDPRPDDDIRHCVFLDVETTGLTVGADRIIELGLLQCSYSFNRRVLLSIDRLYNGFEDPGMPVPAEIQALTGISDAMVQGQRLDDEICAQFLGGKTLIIAHNARFDRPFVDQRFPMLQNAAWACSYTGIKWEILGSHGKKLDYLNMTRGWFYDPHRAFIDCVALLWLLYIEPEAFDMLLDSALKVEYRLFAWKSSYGIKDELKAQGFRYDGQQKVWFKNFLDKAEAEQERDRLFLTYGGIKWELRKIDSRSRFKQ